MTDMETEKEVIGPGPIVAPDLKTGKLRRSIVTPAHIQHWHDRGNEMLAAGLTVPVPCEHDFDAHPMTPAEKLKNNAGWVKGYKIKEGRLLSVLDIQDEELFKKLPTTVRWTSPWFSSFTDGTGVKWDNVIAHLALTTRPRIVDQAPFPSIAAALASAVEAPPEECILSLAGLLDGDKPADLEAFSTYCGVEEKKEEAKVEDGYYRTLLFNLLKKLNVPLPEIVTEDEFKDVLANAAQLKMDELTSAAKTRRPTPNPIVQEQQPMYMSLEDIQKIPDETMRNIALSMYNENVKLQAALDGAVKDTASLRAGKLAEETAKRKLRIDYLSRLSPRVKADLDAMLSLPAMALSLGDGGAVIDPMGSTLSVLEKGLGDLPRLLQTEQTNLMVHPHPTDAEMSQEEVDKLADSQARMMGCPPEKKAS